ncbi:Transglutaminase-like superfamily protein [Candidatus Bilamarchaeum dharawalense]|uniref:Transglutaminase-like superfamily protein n=1 Tax=Candidatus Bilamarchaeum dharawalense TaxID=2885759 RepID=A0A5E4LW70_9ARCH|nr:Transglutaminase-like superfamily protein [Candidatus Bilamarchaeum dharawalense]
MKYLLLVLLVLSLSFATFGSARQVIERTWTISNQGPFQFNGALVVNNSNQHVLSIITEPYMDQRTDEEGVIWLNYSGSGNVRLKAIAIVDVDYNTNITSDATQPKNSVTFTNLTEPDERITFQATRVSNSSSLKTIRNVVDWVHGYITYDLSYWGRSKSAREVFTEGRGVCVEYSHLLISMVESLGFKARYVSGYVYTEAWQPHAWVEISVPGYGWLPADPTFNQIGTLDNSHIAIDYGPDQASIFDSILTQDQMAILSVEDQLSTNFASEDTKGVDLDIALENNTVIFEIDNTNSYFVYGTFVYSMLNTQEEKLLLLAPNERLQIRKVLDQSQFDQNFVYSVPVIAWFNDAKANNTFEIKPESNGPYNNSGSCLSSFVLLLCFSLIFFHRI